MSPESTILEHCRAEVGEVHLFFERWFTGAIKNEDPAFARFPSVLGPDFQIIFPDGRLCTRAEVIEQVRGLHGSKRVNSRYFRIWIENFVPRLTTQELCLATYEEWHEDNGSISARLVSALFRAKPGAPQAVEWLHSHNTWLPGRESHVRGLGRA